MSFYVEFYADDEGRLDKLEAIVAALAEGKETDNWQDDAYWLDFFDEAARAHFWWPTKTEMEDWSQSTASSHFDVWGEGVARIEYQPFGGPYGGNECMVTLIEAFGFRVTANED